MGIVRRRWRMGWGKKFSSLDKQSIFYPKYYYYFFTDFAEQTGVFFPPKFLLNLQPIPTYQTPRVPNHTTAANQGARRLSHVTDGGGITWIRTLFCFATQEPKQAGLITIKRTSLLLFHWLLAKPNLARTVAMFKCNSLHSIMTQLDAVAKFEKHRLLHDTYGELWRRDLADGIMIFMKVIN